MSNYKIPTTLLSLLNQKERDTYEKMINEEKTEDGKNSIKKSTIEYLKDYENAITNRKTDKQIGYDKLLLDIAWVLDMMKQFEELYPELKYTTKVNENYYIYFGTPTNKSGEFMSIKPFFMSKVIKNYMKDFLIKRNTENIHYSIYNDVYNFIIQKIRNWKDLGYRI